ncbi:hypothetical protein TNCV_2876961 [Trichonephila clavipes]|uniref:Uncharacterized protein n=1 Tax=Trichonephila clavipes TaxID=2585209 RepID=A0A8X6WDC4_TRICX|nr:hypothetical protein TNCV_2876961 [Trichonephila clavipes]
MKAGSTLVPVIAMSCSEGGQGNACNQTVCGLDTLDQHLESWFREQFPMTDSRSTLGTIPNTLTANLYVSLPIRSLTVYIKINLSQNVNFNVRCTFSEKLLLTEQDEGSAAFPFETGIHFRRKTDFFPEEDTTKSHSGFEPTRLQAEGHSHHTGCETLL